VVLISNSISLELIYSFFVCLLVDAPLLPFDKTDAHAMCARQGLPEKKRHILIFPINCQPAVQAPLHILVLEHS
jgi:hypothetical protein